METEKKLGNRGSVIVNIDGIDVIVTLSAMLKNGDYILKPRASLKRRVPNYMELKNFWLAHQNK